MVSRRIDDELAATGRWFDMAYLPRTAAAIRSLIGKNIRTSADWHAEVVQVYRGEVVASLNILGEPDPPYHTDLLTALDVVLGEAAHQTERLLDLMMRAKSGLDRVGESHGNTREMYKSLVGGDGSTKHTYLNICLMYLILCEGVFSPQARFLLGVKAVGRGDGEPHAVLAEKVKPAILAERLDNSGLSAFRQGYDRHVRNAIAHGQFRFDLETREMRFRDYKPDSDVLVFEESWPFERMARLFAKLDDTYLVNASYWQVYFLPSVAQLDAPTTVH